MPLATPLQIGRLPVAIINPRQVPNFARATDALARTDAIGTRILALFGAWVQPEIRSLPDKKARDMRNPLRRRRQLVEMLTAKHNRLSRVDEGVCPGIYTHLQNVGKRTTTNADSRRLCS